MAEVKQNVTTRKFIEASGKAKFVEVKSEDEEDSGAETLPEEGEPQEGRGNPGGNPFKDL